MEREVEGDFGEMSDLKIEDCAVRMRVTFPTWNRVLDLLAIIHRDGGHYTEEHGVDKSIEDAIRLSVDRLPIS